PKVLLLDEPLSALDLRIRLEMEVELRRVHRETGAAFVYVTHDQREALALSDRVVVLNAGRIEQAGPSQDVYRKPCNAFVARFVGDANCLPASVSDLNVNGTVEVTVEGSSAVARMPRPPGHSFTPGAGAWLVVRPQAIRVAPLQGAP